MCDVLAGASAGGGLFVCDSIFINVNDLSWVNNEVKDNKSYRKNNVKESDQEID